MSLVNRLCRTYFTRITPVVSLFPERKILDKLERRQIDRRKYASYLEQQKQKQYDRELERAIVERTKSYKEWEYEIDQAKRNIFKKYVSKMDETHPFMVDDYRMEVAKEMHRIDSFYEPIIQREADVLRAKRARGLIHIEPEPFHLAGLDEVIPEIHRLLAEEEEPQQVEAK
ncbi:hypothetical protein WA538_003922, partial [Blastocystis sp. DL]